MTKINVAKKGRPKERVIDKIPIDYEQLVILVSFGTTDEDIAKFFKVSRQTINNWKKDKDFLLHLKKGKEIIDSKVEKSLYERATGYNHPDVHISNFQGKVTITPIIKYYPPDPTSCIFWLKNRKPKEWRERIEFLDDGDADNSPLIFEGWERNDNNPV